jgi:hypothetical protein
MHNDVHERRRDQHIVMCCQRPTRKLSAGAVSLFVCDSCQSRTWMVGDREVSPELALKIARMLDQPGQQL